MQYVMGIEGVIVDFVEEITESVTLMMIRPSSSSSSSLPSKDDDVAITRPEFSQKEIDFLLKLLSQLIQHWSSYNFFSLRFDFLCNFLFFFIDFLFFWVICPNSWTVNNSVIFSLFLHGLIYLYKSKFTIYFNIFEKKTD